MKRLRHVLWVVFIVLAGLETVASAQGVAASPYANMSVADMVGDAAGKVEEMEAAAAEVERIRADAESAEDVATYERLDAIYGQMTARVMVAQEALADLTARRGSSGDGGVDERRALAEHSYGLVLAAHASVMTLHRQALAVVGSEATDGEGTTVSGGSENLPEYDVTVAGNTSTPFSAQDLRDNSEFRGRTPSTALLVDP